MVAVLCQDAPCRAQSVLHRSAPALGLAREELKSRRARNVEEGEHPAIARRQDPIGRLIGSSQPGFRNHRFHRIDIGVVQRCAESLPPERSGRTEVASKPVNLILRSEERSAELFPIEGRPDVPNILERSTASWMRTSYACPEVMPSWPRNRRGVDPDGAVIAFGLADRPALRPQVLDMLARAIRWA